MLLFQSADFDSDFVVIALPSVTGGGYAALGGAVVSIECLGVRTNDVGELQLGLAGTMVESSDISREVYGLLGIPVDAVDMATVISRVQTATAQKVPFLISTANLNFLMTSRVDRDFRESLLDSDLCTADGMPVVWIARLLGIPIKERIAGADLFEALKRMPAGRRLNVFLFGGAEGIAAAACAKLNLESGGIACAGSLDPGFGAIDDMSTSVIIDTINASNADFLVAALGAQKGQIWLRRNHDRLHVPVRAHLGAVINLQAGTIKRAPARLQKWGLEWLWRIREEPQLWRRYWHDGVALIFLVLICVFPLVVVTRWEQLRLGNGRSELQITRLDDHDSVIFCLNGAAIARNIASALPYFEDVPTMSKNVVINFTETSQIDARFLGLILMLDKQLKKQRQRLRFTGVPSKIARIFRLSGFGFLLRSVQE